MELGGPNEQFRGECSHADHFIQMLCLGYISRNIYAIRDQEQKRMVCADSAGFPRIRSHFVFCNSGVVGTILNARMEFTLGVSVNRRRGC